jgi:hypothetical protein
MLVENPRHFGRVEHPVWRVGHGLTAVERAWALLQHRAAFVAYSAMSAAGLSVDDLAAAVGQQSTWVVRKLNGHAPADVGDFVAWASVLGVDVWPVLDSTDFR